MAVLRARLGITEEKSSVDESSSRVGVKDRALQAKTQAFSNVWPEVTITGSAIRDPEMGQRNSFGGSFDLGCRGGEDENLLKRYINFHLRLGVIVGVGVGVCLILPFSVSFSNPQSTSLGL